MPSEQLEMFDDNEAPRVEGPTYGQSARAAFHIARARKALSVKNFTDRRDTEIAFHDRIKRSGE